MNYDQALERAKTTPVMRPHWRWVWLTFEKGRHLLLYDAGRVEPVDPWKALKNDRDATNWMDAPRSPDDL